jgi:hypothetical protein
MKIARELFLVIISLVVVLYLYMVWMSTIQLPDFNNFENRYIANSFKICRQKFRPTSFLRAVIANITSGGYSQGGSTIDQQVVKNALLSREKTVTRKLKEIILSLKLDRELSKDVILQIYLNESPYGGTIYGVEEASHIFLVNMQNVTLTEAHTLQLYHNLQHTTHHTESMLIYLRKERT